jgi:hypothetical protein
MTELSIAGGAHGYALGLVPSHRPGVSSNENADDPLDLGTPCSAHQRRGQGVGVSE